MAEGRVQRMKRGKVKLEAEVERIRIIRVDLCPDFRSKKQETRSGKSPDPSVVHQTKNTNISIRMVRIVMVKTVPQAMILKPLELVCSPIIFGLFAILRA